MRCFLILVPLVTSFGQSLTIGVKAGGRVTDDFSYAAVSESKRYVVGPSLELGLPLGFGVEVDALYRHDGYRVAGGNFAFSDFTRGTANSWEFPILLQYRLPVPVIKPFLEAGYVPRVVSGSASSNLLTTFPNTTYSHTQGIDPWPTSQGVLVGGGIRLGFGRLRLSPEVRYTHWNNTPISGVFPDGPSYQSTQNQVDVMVGIGWKVRGR